MAEIFGQNLNKDHGLASHSISPSIQISHLFADIFLVTAIRLKGLIDIPECWASRGLTRHRAAGSRDLTAAIHRPPVLSLAPTVPAQLRRAVSRYPHLP